MFKSTLFVAALAAVAFGALSTGASATDDRGRAYTSVASSSNDSWDRCDEDDRRSGNSYGRDDRRKCVTKRRDPRDPRDSGGSGGSSTN